MLPAKFAGVRFFRLVFLENGMPYGSVVFRRYLDIKKIRYVVGICRSIYWCDNGFFFKTLHFLHYRLKKVHNENRDGRRIPNLNLTALIP